MEQQLYELLRQCTVRLSVPGKVGHGTGFFVAPGLILTCAHVIMAAQSNNTSVDVYWNDQLLSAQIMVSLPDPDLALLQVNLTNHPCAYLHEEAIPFDALYSYGYPDNHSIGDPATFSLEGKAGDQGEQLKFKTGQVRPGLSGAPLLNVRTGYVCGIVQLTRDRSNDLGGRAITTTTVLRLFPELVAQQQLFHLLDRCWTNCLWEVVARTKYLEGIIRRYSSVTIPIGPAQGFSIQAIFQPLKLRRDPLAAEDLIREERRALLGEPRYSDEDPRRVSLRPETWQSHSWAKQAFPVVIAENGDEALKKSSKRSIVVLGGPGTGKTTLLQYLISDRAKNALDDLLAPLPIFILLPDLARSGKTLKEYLSSIVQDMMVDERYAQTLWQAIDQGKAFVCLDSLDEVTPKQRPEKISLIDEWAASTPNTYIVGSRFTDYKGGQLRREQFTEWELLPLNFSMRQELAKRLLPELCRLISSADISADSSTFVNILEQHEQAAAWGQNPLLFSLAAAVFVRTGVLPPSRAMLYQQVTSAILEFREPDRTRREMLRSVLISLALELYQAKGRTFNRNDLLSLLRIVRKRQDEQWDTEEMAHRVINSGIIEVVARDIYGFRHQTFQEYLAATELAQRLMSKDRTTQEEAWGIAWSKRTYSRWTEVLRLMVGVLDQDFGRQGTQKAVQWLLTLVQQRKQLEGDPGDLGLALALKSLREVIVTKVDDWYDEKRDIEDRIVTMWIEELLNTVWHEARQKRLRNLAPEIAYLNTYTVRAVLEKLLAVSENKTIDREVRQAAVGALGNLGKLVPIERLVTLVDNKVEDDLVREAAIEALGELGERAPVELLVKLVGDQDENVFIGLAVVKALGELGEHVPVERMVALLDNKDNKDNNVWQAAVEVLGKLGERAPIERLLALLNDTDDKLGLRQRIVLSLGELGERTPVERLLALLDDPNEDSLVRQAVVWSLGERLPIERLVALLDDEDESISLSAIHSLGGQGEQAPIERLIGLLDVANINLRQAAVEALVALRQSAIIKQLMENLDERMWGERRIAVDVLGELGERAPMEPLVALLDDTNEDVFVRQAAVEALGKLGERAPVERLLELLGNKQETVLVRRAAVEALGKLGERAPVQRLVALLDDTNEDVLVRQAAVEALGGLGERAPVQCLIKLLDNINEDSVVRQLAVYALGNLGEQAPAKRLLALLDDANEYKFLRQLAVRSLGGLGERAPVERLIALLDDPDWEMRYEAVDTLGKLGERAPVERLVALANDKGEKELMREQAVRALGSLGEHAPVEQVLALLDDANRSLRYRAVEALEEIGKHIPIERLMLLVNNVDSNLRKSALQALTAYSPTDHLVKLLDDVNSNMRLAALRALKKAGEHVPLEKLLLAVGDSDERVRKRALEVLQQLHPEVLPDIVSEATAILQRRGAGLILGSPARVSIAQTLGDMKNASSDLFEQLTDLLDWPHWQVQESAAQALGKLRRNIPNRAIKRLYDLRLNSQSQAVREAVDDALAEILSLETGIEDD